MGQAVAMMDTTDIACIHDSSSDFAAAEMEKAARHRICAHPHFRSRLSSVDVRFEEETLILSGNLPSFYLKQLVQEAIRGLTVRIRNDIDVISSSGLSSVRNQCE